MNRLFLYFLCDTFASSAFRYPDPNPASDLSIYFCNV